MARRIAADADDGVKTDEVHKRRDVEQPFHRIGQRFTPGSSERRPPSFRLDLRGPVIDGRGFDRPSGFENCRRPSTILRLSIDRLRTLAGSKPLSVIASQLARTVPAWILVERHVGFPPLFSEPNAAFQEVQGKLIRSFQTWTDFPVAQYHSWYDWNFHVEPVEGYRHLPGPANSVEGLDGKTPVVKGASNTMECEWDTGAFGKKPGSMFLPNVDWCWPMAGDFVWIAGRWIYDCGHANAQEQVRTELHPCAAVATARWEGIEFNADRTEIIWPPGSDEKATFRPAKNTPAVPGIRFMFFASKLGGYRKFATLANPNNAFDKNYRFIVDLPSIDGEARAVAVGATPDVGQNTVVVPNPMLLASFSFDAFANNASGKFQRKDPIITVIDRGAGKLPNQVIVEIPIDQLDADTDSYGVIVSLGWHDNGNVLARRVVKCTVTIVSVTIPDPKPNQQAPGGGFVPTNWVLKIGVNGRWSRHLINNLDTRNDVRSIGRRESFFLPLDHPTPAGAPININAHGKVRRLVGVFLERAPADRTARLQGRPFDYDRDTILVTDDQAVDVVDELASLQASTFAEENDPIGIFDLKESVTAIASSGGVKRLFHPALSVEEKKPLAELVFVNDRPGQEQVDYRVSLAIRTEPQAIP